MGQKLNPIIFRLGINKTWKTEFFEKKNQELPLYIFKDLEIHKYIERIFETNGIIIHDYKQHYNASTLNLYLSYFITSDFITSNKRRKEHLILKTADDKKIVVKKRVGKNDFLNPFFSAKTIKNLFAQDFSKLYKIKQYLKMYPHYKPIIKSLSTNSQQIKKNESLRYSSNQTKTKLEGFFADFFTVLNLFLGNQSNIVVNFCCINKNVQHLKSMQNSPFISFQKFKNTPFFKEGIELLFNVVHNINSANLLAKFIAFQLKKVKRHKFLLSFLKQTLTVLLNSRFAKVKGIKIIVKGRLNGVPRAKHKIIIIGDVPVQTISANLDYSQVTAHNSNGSYGIKVWVVEK